MTELMLTGDLNVIDVQWIIQYRIEDPIRLTAYRQVQEVQGKADAEATQISGRAYADGIYQAF